MLYDVAPQNRTIKLLHPEDNFGEAEDLFDRLDEKALELYPQDRAFKRIKRGIRSIKDFVKEVKETIKTVKDVIKNARYYMGMFRSARDYMKSYRRTNPVPRSLLQDLGIDEKVHLCFSKTPITYVD